MAPNNNTKKRLFEESGMTADERRLLRKQQRQLAERIARDERGAKENSGENTGDDDDEKEDAGVEKQDCMEFLDHAREENNELFNSVAFTREAVLDAENADMIASKTLQQVDRLVQVSVLLVYYYSSIAFV
jgi:hypothetical protein